MRAFYVFVAVFSALTAVMQLLAGNRGLAFSEVLLASLFASLAAGREK